MSTAEIPEPAPALVAARAFAARGWRPFPLDHPSLAECAAPHRRRPCDGKRGKHPVGGWGTQTASPPTDGMLRLWFSGPARNIGVAAGPSGLLILDEDRPDALAALAEQLGEDLPDTYRVMTSRGWHYYFTDPDNEFGNTAGVLASHGIDVRGGKGAGGYVVAAGSTHQSGTEYVAEDSAADVAPLPEWIKTLIRTPTTTQPAQDGPDSPGGPPEGGWTDEPRYGLPDELRGQYNRHLAAVRTRGGEFRHELFLAALDGWRLVDCGLIDELTMLMQIREAIRRVWGADPDDDDRHIVYEEARDKAAASPWVALDPLGAASESGSSDAAESSWDPKDLDALWDDAAEPLQPTILSRKDGRRLFYRRKTHSVHGESESGKSWVVQTAAVDVLRDGGRVLYLDYESDERAILERLRLLGLEREWLPRLDYVTPDGPRDERFTALLGETYDLAVIDGVTAAISSEPDAKSNSSDDVTAWDKALPRRIAATTGAAVVMVDHVSKAKDERGRFAIGSQAKMANISGAAYYVDVEAVLAPGRKGCIRIYVGKDRPGGVRRHAGPMRADRLQPYARLTIDGSNPGLVGVALWPWVGKTDQDADGPDLTVGEAVLGPLWWEKPTAELPDAVRKLSGNYARTAQDIWRLLDHIGDPNGLTTSQIIRELEQLPGTRRPAKTAVYGAIVRLDEVGVVDRDRTRNWLA